MGTLLEMGPESWENEEQWADRLVPTGGLRQGGDDRALYVLKNGEKEDIWWHFKYREPWGTLSLFSITRSIFLWEINISLPQLRSGLVTWLALATKMRVFCATSEQVLMIRYDFLTLFVSLCCMGKSFSEKGCSFSVSFGVKKILGVELKQICTKHVM